MSLIRALDAADGRKLAQTGLHEFCDHVQAGLGELSDAIGQAYFRAAHAQSLSQKQFNLA